MQITKLIGNLIPNKQTNILRIIVNGFDAAIDSLINMINSFIVDRNILTTENVKALRGLVAENGFEPSLFVPAKGIVNLSIKASYFNDNGNDIFLPPYAKFKCRDNGLNYFYDSNKPLKLQLTQNIPLTEGLLITENIDINLFNNFDKRINNEVVKFYINHDNIAEKSISVIVDGVHYKETKSFINKFNGNYFIVKYSDSVDYPIVVYIANGSNKIKTSSTIVCNYRVCNGINGLLDVGAEFDCDGVVGVNGIMVAGNDDIITISKYGFSFGGNGTSVDTMKSQIGYNHNNGLLFDLHSYREFIWKYSNILLHHIELHKNDKAINDIYISKKLFIDNIKQYRIAINNLKYKLTDAEMEEFSNIININEYCLSTHNLFNSPVNKYAFQIKFKTIDDLNKYRSELEKIIYDKFMLFLRTRNLTVNFNKLFYDFMQKYDIIFDYYMFDNNMESLKIKNKKNYKTDYILTSDKNIPILNGNFYIANSAYEPERLFFDINFVIK